MSQTNALPFRLETVRLPSGEARAFLMDGLGCPHDYSTLYITVRVRNAGKSVASQQRSLSAINILYRHCFEHEIDLVRRFSAGEFLTAWEVEALRSSIQYDFGILRRSVERAVVLRKGKKGHRSRRDTVVTATQRVRLSYIADFAKWLGNYLNGTRDNARAREIAAMCQNILAIRPDAKRLGEDLDKNLFTRAQNALLNVIIEPGSPRNPFSSEVQLRNKLLIYLLRSLGKRRGEALNIQLGDIDFGLHRIVIVRRADSRDDPREMQPLVKTREHAIPLTPEGEQLVAEYLRMRRGVPGARRHPYLLVTHKSGPTLGQPMSIAALNKVFHTLRLVSPELESVHAHLLRHFHSDSMALQQIGDGPSTPHMRETARRTRNLLAGRRPDSGMDELYTRRAIEKEAAEVARRVQRETMNAPARDSLE